MMAGSDDRPSHTPPLQAEAARLLASHQYKSCELVALMELSQLKQRTSAGRTQNRTLGMATALELLGDCAANTDRNRQANDYYRDAAELVHDHYGRIRGAGKNGEEATSHWEADLRVKESRALSNVGSVVEAAAILERSFPAAEGRLRGQRTAHEYATLESTMLLGNLLEKSGRAADAKVQYRYALAKNPYALEAAEKLAKLECDERTIGELIDEGLKKRREESNGEMSDAEPELPLRDYAQAQSTWYKNQLANSLRLFDGLSSQFPYHPHLILQKAHIQQELGHILAAEQNYKLVRALDPHWVEGLEKYAHLLFQLRMSRKNAFVLKQGGFLHYQYSCHGGRDKMENSDVCGIEDELGQLSADLLDIDDKRPEPWVCLSLFYLAKEDHEKSLAYADKAIAIDQQHQYAHWLRGSILLSSHRADQAVVSFFRANDLRKDIPSYEGLVESYLAAQKYKEAICTAKEAISSAPRDARAITLVGLALSQAPASQKDGEGKERAKKALKRAMALDPGAPRALFALVDLHCSEGDYDACIKLLRDAIDDGKPDASDTTTPTAASGHAVTWNKEHPDVMQAKLAEMYTHSERYTEALECYHIAISMNPQNGLAIQGLERLEKLVRGFDPDEEMGEGEEYHSAPED